MLLDRHFGLSPAYAAVLISLHGCVLSTEGDGDTAPGLRVVSVVDHDAGPLPPTPPPPAPNAYPTFQQAALAQNQAATLLGDQGYAIPVPTLTPRLPHLKPTAPTNCTDLEVGPNAISIKFHDGEDVRLGPNGFYSIDPGFPAAHQTELSTINGIADFFPLVMFDEATPSELLEEKARAEDITGLEQPDLTQWFVGYVGTDEAGLLEDVHDDSSLCARVATLLNDFNAMAVVELAEQVESGNGGRSFDVSPPAIDIAPTSPEASDEPLDPFSLTSCGVNKPEVLSELDPQIERGYQGENAGIVIVEGGSATHESFNSTNIGGSSCVYGRNNGADHSMHVQSVAYAASRSGWDSANPRYGVRGVSPRVASALRRACKGIGLRRANAQAIRVGFDSPGDVINVSRQHNSFQTLLTKNSVRDASQLVTSQGGFVNLIVGNRNAWVIDRGPNNGIRWGRTERDFSGAFLVAGVNSATLCAPQFSRGSRVDLSARSDQVWGASRVGGSGFELLPDGQRYDVASGTSVAAPIISGVIAGFVGAYYNSLGHGRTERRFPASGDPRDVVTPMLRNDEVLAALQLASPFRNALTGAVPDASKAVLDFATGVRFLASPDYSEGTTRRVWRAAPPHGREHVVMIGADTVSAPATGITFESPSGGQPARWTSVDSEASGTWIVEPRNGTAFSGALDYQRVEVASGEPEGMTIEAWVRVQRSTERWQTVISKENPRNYGLWVGPIGHPAEGLIHFSFHPEGSSAFCSSDGSIRVDDGNWHHIVAVQGWASPGSTPETSFFVDGVFDRQVATCSRPEEPMFRGPGGNFATVGRSLSAGSSIRYVAVYRRRMSAGEVSDRFARGVFNPL